MIRHAILKLFRRTGAPPSMAEIASEVGVSEGEIKEQLAKEEKLSELFGLSIKQAHTLLEFYGRDVLFSEDIADAVGQTVETKQKIQRVEAKKRGPGNLPPKQ